MKFRDFGISPPAEGFSPPAKILQRARILSETNLAAGENISPPAKPLSPPAENFSPPAKIPQFPKFHFFLDLAAARLFSPPASFVRNYIF